MISQSEGLADLRLADLVTRAAAALPEHAAALRPIASAHRDAGLAAVSAANYEGAHWLGTFAVYLLTLRCDEPDPTAAEERA